MIFSFAPDFCLVVKAEEQGELQGGQSSIVNGSFENPPNYRLEDLAQALGSQKGYKEKTPQNEIPGWNTTSTEGAIELGWLKGNGTSPHMVPTVGNCLRHDFFVGGGIAVYHIFTSLELVKPQSRPLRGEKR